MKWKMQCSLALLAALLAINSDTAQAQRQRSPIRSVPVGADVKRDNDFNCPEEFGYYAHPSDCSQYYVCVFGGALLESCTGGLMYSNELQTCDWPRNVGCSAGAEGGVSDPAPAPVPVPVAQRAPPQRVPVRVQAPPPPPRPSPNPVVTSRGQPTYVSHQDIPKQQLYVELEEQLPPAEETESNHPQRVNRGQPSTVGRVQQDRDGQARTPNSISHEKIGSFSFGTQTESQRYSESLLDLTDTDQYVTEPSNDIASLNDLTHLPNNQTVHHRNTREAPVDKQMERTPTGDGDEVERDKRQIRYGRVQQDPNLSPSNGHNQRWNEPKQNLQNGHSIPINHHSSAAAPFKPSAQIDNGFSSYAGSGTAVNTQQFSPILDYNNNNNNAYNRGIFKSTTTDSNKYPTSSPKYSPSASPNFSNSKFKSSYSDNPFLPMSTTPGTIFKENFQYFSLSPGPTASLTITKAPPISSIHDGPFAALSGGFYNNKPETNLQYSSKRNKPSKSLFDNHSSQGSNHNNFEYSPQKSESFRSTSSPAQRPLRYENIRGNHSGNRLQSSASTPTATRTKSSHRHRDSRPNSGYRGSNHKDNDRKNRLISHRRPKTDQSHDSSNDRPENTNENESDEDSNEENDEKTEKDENSDEESEDDGKNESGKEAQNNDEEEDEQSPEIKPPFPPPPDYFRNVENKYENVVNPFADPEFDFDHFISKIRSSHLAVVPKKQVDQLNNKIQENINTPRASTSLPVPVNNQENLLIKDHHNYQGMSTPRPFSATTKSVSWPPVTTENLKTVNPTNQAFKPVNPKPVYEDDSDDYYEDDYEQPAPLKNHVKPSIPSQYPHKPIKPQYQGSPKVPSSSYRPQTYSYNGNYQKPYSNQSSSNRPPPQSGSYNNAYRNPNSNQNSQYYSNNVSQKPKYHSSFNGNIGSTSPSYKDHRNEYKNVQSDNNRYNNQNYRDSPKIKPTNNEPLSNDYQNDYKNVNDNRYNTQDYRDSPSSHSTKAYEGTTKSYYNNEHKKLPPNNGYTNQNYRETTKFQPIKSSEPTTEYYRPPQKSINDINSYRGPITTDKSQGKRRPIPKPSPEMNDYYYDDEDDDDYDYEPPVKSKFMPSTEVKPQRPPIAQNYEEYEDYDVEDSKKNKGKPVKQAITNETSNEDDDNEDDEEEEEYEEDEENHNDKNKEHNDNEEQQLKRPQIEHNSNAPIKSQRGHSNHHSGPHPSKTTILVPVKFETFNVHTRPKDHAKPSYPPRRPKNNNFEVQHSSANLASTKIPTSATKPRYSNHTTARPYTVRSRLNKPSSTKPTYSEIVRNPKKGESHLRHPTRGSQRPTTSQDLRTYRQPTSSRTPPKTDSDNQETRFSHTDHDDNAPNRVEPIATAPPTYTRSQQSSGRALYNGSLQYDPQAFNPYYAQYDDDVELYKDTDYVQQYNSAAQRPGASQGTYRGTPPPRASQPTAAPTPLYTPTQSNLYSAQPSADDYDDALISQIDDHNQYQQPHRPSTTSRARPTLKPSTSIVSKATEFVDIYRFPPRRPDLVYPTPQADKTAAKCRKDVCLLPDCSCGGKDIPGNLPVEEVPQMVLITFDDAVNDLNKGTYSELFEQGRKNPNGCPIAGTFYVSHEWTDYSQVQNLYADGHEMASHTVSHSFGEQFSQKKWNREVAGQREILAAYGGVKLEDVRGMRAPFLSVGGNKMFKMLYDSNFTYDSSMPVYENRPPSWPYTLDYKLFHDCMIPPCPTKSYPGVWEVPMVMWQDLNGGRCSMGDACSNPPEAEGVYKMLLKNFDRHYTTNRAPFGLFYHAAWFTQPHHKQGFIMFLDAINAMKDVFLVTNWQALQWVRDPTPLSRINSFQPFHCNYQDRPKRCNNPKVCNLWHKSGVRYMRTCQPCPEIYPWTGKTGIRSSRIDNDIED